MTLDRCGDEKLGFIFTRPCRMSIYGMTRGNVKTKVADIQN